jgi:4-amino-4-deoxy-L-arabinose transferase-like glycosyltransferase
MGRWISNRFSELVSQILSFTSRPLRACMVLFSLYYVAIFLFIAGSRISYPFDLEWMEGGVLEHVIRVLDGKSIYVRPSFTFTPFLYTPLYYYVCAPVLALFGGGLSALRAVSASATILTFAFLYLIVRASTKDRGAAFIAVGVFAATFVVAGAWFDIARVDSLYLCLLACGLWLIARAEPRDFLAGLCFGLAFLTKQTALFVFLPLGAARVFTERGLSRLYCVLGFGLIAGLGSLALNVATHGWFFFYVFQLPRTHNLVSDSVISFWRTDIFQNVPFIVAAAIYRLTRGPADRALALRWAAAIGFLGSVWLSRLHVGGFSNVLLPGFFVLAWMTGEAVAGDSACTTRSEPTQSALTNAPGPGFFATVLVLLHLGFLFYLPTPHIPTAADREAGMALVDRLAKLDGPVLVPFHVHLARLAGKSTAAHEMAIWDVLRGNDRKVASKLEQDVRSSLRSKHYAAIVLDREWWPGEVNRGYQKDNKPPVSAPDIFFGRTGIRTRPESFYVPKKKAVAQRDTGQLICNLQ